MKTVFIRPPQYNWPILDRAENEAFPPLGYLSLAGQLIQNKICEVKIIDCPSLKIGWKSLRKKIERLNPDVICVGSETACMHEAVKIFEMAKEINPRITTVAGGWHFSTKPVESLVNFPIDFIVRWEGEITLMELIQELQKSKSGVKEVKGIVFKQNGKIIETSLRSPIEDLDELPFPAWQLIPNIEDLCKKNVPVPMMHSRGCVSNCRYCSCWEFEGYHWQENGVYKVKPFYRTKSVERMINEIEIVVHKLGLSFIHFIDNTWNVDMNWNEKFSQALLNRADLKISWSAYLRADFILRDEEKGIFEKMVKAGLVHVFMGIERLEEEELKYLGRPNIPLRLIEKVNSLLKLKYPQLIVHGALIIGLPWDTKESIKKIIEYAVNCKMDLCSVNPLIPYPGTQIWNEMAERGWLNDRRYSQYDNDCPVLPTEFMSKEEINKIRGTYYKKFLLEKIFRIIRNLFSPYKFKRKFYWDICKAGLLIIQQWSLSVGGVIRRSKRPKWYDN